MSENSTGKALVWKLLERFSAQGIQFVLQIILARLLSPEHYGALSIMIIFTNIANVFVQSGFGTALIQKKNADEKDYSSVFWFSFLVATVLYMVIFLSAPIISQFYDMPDIVTPFRVLGLVLFPGALNSVQLAKASKTMNFRNIFISNLFGIIISGAIGVIIALNGGGVWTLVIQTLTHTTATCFVMFVTVKWMPKLVLDFKKIGSLYKYAWKILVSATIDVFYQDLRSLVIGKKYSSDTLGYYNKGKQFPQFIINAINGAVQAVMLPVLSKEQDDKAKLKALMRNSIVVSSYVIFPMMMGLAVVATPLIRILLTDKWLPCVPYLQIYCFTLAFTPIHSCNLQAINAVGRSDIFLKLEIIKKTIGISSLVVAVFCFDSPIAIAMTGVFTTFTSCFINAYPNKKLINYSYFEQMKDIIPSLLVTVLMGVCAYAITFIGLGKWTTMFIQIFVGIVAYLAFSALFKLEGFKFVVNQTKNILNKKKAKKED